MRNLRYAIIALALAIGLLAVYSRANAQELSEYNDTVLWRINKSITVPTIEQKAELKLLIDQKDRDLRQRNIEIMLLEAKILTIKARIYTAKGLYMDLARWNPAAEKELFKYSYAIANILMEYPEYYYCIEDYYPLFADVYEIVRAKTSFRYYQNIK